MRYLVCLMILASSCVLPPAPAIEFVHPDWPPQIQENVRNGRYLAGMTRDQFECALAYWLGGNVNGNHWHMRPDSSSVSSDGLSIYVYNVPQSYTTITGTFLDGKLQNCTNLNLR